MNTDALKKAVRLIGYWKSGDETAVKEILNAKYNLEKNIYEPFDKELNENLLIKETWEGKRDLIKYYIFEFHFLYPFFKNNEQIILHEFLDGYDSAKYKHINESGKKRKLNKYENYV